MNHFWARIPGKATSHEIPILSLLHWHFLHARESRDWHCDAAAILQGNLKLTPFEEMTKP